MNINPCHDVKMRTAFFDNCNVAVPTSWSGGLQRRTAVRLYEGDPRNIHPFLHGRRVLCAYRQNSVMLKIRIKTELSHRPQKSTYLARFSP